MINNVTLVGRLTKDPQIRTTPSGVEIGQFSLAVNRNFSNNNGQKETDFIQIVVFRKQAQLCGQYLHKGSLCGIIGRIQTRNYDKDGQRIYVTEIVADNVQFLEPKNNNNNGGYQQSYNSNNSYPQQNNNYQQSYNQNNSYPQQNNYNQQTQNSSYQAPQQNNYNQQTQAPSYAPPIKQNNAQQAQQGSPNPFANANNIEINDDDLPF